MALKRIRLELARTPEAPEGNPYCGYEFTAPLDRRAAAMPKSRILAATVKPATIGSHSPRRLL